MMRLLLILVIAVGYTGYHYWGTGQENTGLTGLQQATRSQLAPSPEQKQGGAVQESAVHGEQAIREAFKAQARHLQVEASATVVKLLEDDTQAPRHQRFVVKLNNGITLLIAHNIDLAERVVDIKVGDTISFYGEYEWNKKGGVVHWTHHDPQGSHVAGWLRHNGKTYQ